MKDLPKIEKDNFLQRFINMQQDILGYGNHNFNDLGSTFRTDFIIQDVIFTRESKWIQHVLQTNHRNYSKGRAYEELQRALGKGLLNSEGDLWKRQRKLAQPAFYKKRLEKMMDAMMGVIRKHINRWIQLKDGNQEISLDEEFLNVSSDIVIATLLGDSIKSDIPDIAQFIVEMQELIIKLIRIPYYKYLANVTGEQRKFNKLKLKFDQVVYEIIKARKDSKEQHDDLLGMLMDARDEETGKAMSDEQLRDEFITIFVAGHETTAFALSWTFYLLGQHPSVYDRLKEESSNFDINADLDMKGWQNLKYATAVIKEGMRLFPPAYFVSRQALADDTIDGHQIFKNDVVIMSFYNLHRDPNVWDNALSFDPERFMGEKMSENERHNYYPFGAGPRMCIGNNFAMMEAVLVISAFFKHLDFELVKNHLVVPEPLITLRPKYGLKVKFR